MAIPRMSPGAQGRPSLLPTPLAPSEAARVKRVLDLQARGKLAEAATEAESLSDPTLLGHILAARYLGPHTQTTPEQLRDWMQRFADEADAPAILALLARKSPKAAALPRLPERPALAEDTDRPMPEEIDPKTTAINRDPVLDRAVQASAASGNDRAALRLVASRRALGLAYASLLRAEIAQQLFLQNRDGEAFDLASRAVKATPIDQQSGFAGYVAGLAAWRLGKPELARSYFEGAWRAPYASPAVKSAGAFWAARAHLGIRNPAGYTTWLRRAAAETRTLHGLIARRMLGIAPGFDWDTETLGEAEAEAIAGTPEGRRALAYIQIGEPSLAEAELRRLFPQVQDGPMAHAVMLVAGQAGLTDLAAQIAEIAQAADGRPRDNLRFPVPKLRPRGGFRIDPALVYGLTRVESNFNAAAVSPVGARGLMQLMPVTAGFVDPSIAGRAARLHDPALNLDLGQQYVAHLADLDQVGGDLLRMLASYNSGPGNFGRWGPDIRHNDDPLLFIEAIPVTETRNFVQHVLFYTWIYAARLRLPAPSLDAMAAGTFPRLSRPDSPIAANAVFTPGLH